MDDKSFLTVEQVAQMLSVSESYAYKVIRELNAELKKQGYVTIRGRINVNYFQKKLCYTEN